MEVIGAGFECPLCGEQHRTSDVHCKLKIEGMKTDKKNWDSILSEYSDRFYSLIDRLKKHSEWKYPERKWTFLFYYECAFQWKGKEKELEERVLKLEDEMRVAQSL